MADRHRESKVQRSGSRLKKKRKSQPAPSLNFAFQPCHPRSPFCNNELNSTIGRFQLCNSEPAILSSRARSRDLVFQPRVFKSQNAPSQIKTLSKNQIELLAAYIIPSTSGTSSPLRSPPVSTDTSPCPQIAGGTNTSPAWKPGICCSDSFPNSVIPSEVEGPCVSFSSKSVAPAGLAATEVERP